MTHRIIIDTDPGQDDAIAILLALARPEIGVLGITRSPATCRSRSPRPTLSRSSSSRAHRRPGLRRCDRAPHAPRSSPPSMSTARRGSTASTCRRRAAPRDRHAVDFIVETLRARAGGQGHPVLLGPLTNIAIAFAARPTSSAGRAASSPWAAASFEVGNTTPTAEFNIYVDPTRRTPSSAAGRLIVLPARRHRTDPCPTGAATRHFAASALRSAGGGLVVGRSSSGSTAEVRPGRRPAARPDVIGWLLRRGPLSPAATSTSRSRPARS